MASRFCGKCRTVFATDAELYDHMPCDGRHYGDADIFCPFCGTWFTTYAALYAHDCEDHILTKEDASCHKTPIGSVD